MKYLCTVLLSLLAFPLIVSAHPGSLDEKGGHMCHTNCTQWGLTDGMYHYHTDSEMKKYDTLNKTIEDNVKKLNEKTQNGNAVNPDPNQPTRRVEYRPEDIGVSDQDGNPIEPEKKEADQTVWGAFLALLAAIGAAFRKKIEKFNVWCDHNRETIFQIGTLIGVLGIIIAGYTIYAWNTYIIATCALLLGLFLVKPLRAYMEGWLHMTFDESLILILSILEIAFVIALFV